MVALIRKAIVNSINSMIDGLARGEGLDGMAELMAEKPKVAAEKLRLVAVICNANSDSIRIKGRRKRLWAAAADRLEIEAVRLEKGLPCRLELLKEITA